MTRLCVAIFVTDLARARRDIAAAAEAGADMVELRIDQFCDEGAVRQLVSDCALPAVVTCRASWEGGHCELPDAERASLLRAAAEAGASYIDVELRAWQRSAELRQQLSSGQEGQAGAPRERRAGLILSAHEFVGRPARMHNLVADLDAAEGDVNKLAWTARTIRDNVEAFELLAGRRKPTIALCMGEAGLISRVLARKFGALLTFAALDRDGGTAPGQVAVAEMKRLYRWDAIGPATRVYGVVAQPVAHSMSPAIHNAAFDATGFDGVYLPLLVEGSYESFKAFMESFLAFEPLGLSGLSVTIPHKENALRYLRSRSATVEPLAERIGSVNTIVIERQGGEVRLRGMNTDYAAILDSIAAGLGIGREGLAGLKVAVIGAGGTGRAAVAALAQYGAHVTVYNRTLDRAAALAREFDGQTGRVAAAPLDQLARADCRVYVNATSVGMHPNVDASAFGPTPPALGPGTLVFDTVYNPMTTRLLEQARAAGARTVGGVEMFVRQAVAQFEAWTGATAPAEVMRRVVERRLGGQASSQGAR